MKASIIGTGYVGLVTGACLADVGNHVMCFDVDKRKIEKLRGGEIPIFEPGLKEVVHNNVASGRLSFTADVKESALYAKLQVIAVGTPPGGRLRGSKQDRRRARRDLLDAGPVIRTSHGPVGTATKVPTRRGHVEQRGAGVS